METLEFASEVGKRGEAIYQETLRDRLEPDFDGQFVVIDVDSGDYEVDGKDVAATLRLQARKPDALIWGTRVGRSAAYVLGSAFAIVAIEDANGI